MGTSGAEDAGAGARVFAIALASLARCPDAARRAALTAVLLPTPLREWRDWDYGAPGERLAVWLVVADADLGVGIAYADGGFGPDFPWGAVHLSDQLVGRDDSWFASIDEAFVVSGLWRGPPPTSFGSRAQAKKTIEAHKGETPSPARELGVHTRRSERRAQSGMASSTTSRPRVSTR